VADKREIFYSGVGLGRDGNVEHEQSGFIWGLDNWIYSTAEIERAVPVLMQSHIGWKTSASHNAATAAQGLTLAGWTSIEPQRPGMWFQVELPEAVNVAEVRSMPPVEAGSAAEEGTAGAAREAQPRDRPQPFQMLPTSPPGAAQPLQHRRS
jgi:hypothetical protein